MTHSLLKSILILTLAFTAFSLAARVLGSTHPPNPALEGFTVGCEDRPQPCWYGIVPGVTTTEEAARVLQSHGYVVLDNPSSYEAYSLQSCHVQLHAQPDAVASVYIVDCDMQLGDVMSQLGSPGGLSTSCGIKVYFQNVAVGLKPAVTKIAPESKIDFIALFSPMSPGAAGSPVDIKYKWIGFTSVAQYERLNLGSSRCVCCEA